MADLNHVTRKPGRGSVAAMGWNTGYTIFEATVIGAYDLGVLTPELLAILCEPYRDTDIDSGGSCELAAKDGLLVEEVVIAVIDPDGWAALKKGRDAEGEEAQDEYQEALYDAFHEITASRFGWG